MTSLSIQPLRLHKTMRQILFWTSVETAIARLIKTCLKYKLAEVHVRKKDFGIVPLRTLSSVNMLGVIPVDLIGPYEDGSYGITMIEQAKTVAQCWCPRKPVGADHCRWLQLGMALSIVKST